MRIGDYSRVSRYRMGRFVLDQDARQLFLEADEIHLSPKAFELLTILIANRTRVVPKAELQERLWPSTYVEETNLAGLVAEIRRALGDDADRPAFIRTMYRVGYRFVADVVDIAPASRAGLSPGKLRLVYQQRELPLLNGANVIGRAPDSAIVCDAAGVSRHHARILVSNGEAMLEDLGSKNGTYLQHKRINSARLSDGDEIRLGRATLIFRIEPALGPTETIASE